MKAEIQAKFRAYVLAGGSPKKWSVEAVSRGLVASAEEVSAVLESWRSRGWYDSALVPGDGWLTAAGAAAFIEGAA